MDQQVESRFQRELAARLRKLGTFNEKLFLRHAKACPSMENFRTILINFPALVTAFELAYGKHHWNDFGFQNVAVGRAWLDFLWRIVRFGQSEISAWCHNRRLRATGNPLRQPTGRTGPCYPCARLNGSRVRAQVPGQDRLVGRGVTPLALMAASGLDRAFRAKAPQEKIERERDEAFERITGYKSELSETNMNNLLKFVHNVCKKARRTMPKTVHLATPNGNACRESSVREGGQTGAVVNWIQSSGVKKYALFACSFVLMRYRAKKAMIAAKRSYERIRDIYLSPQKVRHPWALPEIDLPDLDEAWWDLERANHEFRHYERVPEPGDKLDWRLRCVFHMVHAPIIDDTVRIALTGQVAGREAARRLIDRGYSEARLSVFPNHNGKLRLATVHDVETVVVAKCITSFLLSGLRQVRTNSSQLRNQPVDLINTDPTAVCYSADWSKATDHISCRTATLMLQCILDGLGAPQWMRDAACFVTDNIFVSDETGRSRRVTCGALMGLGPSWTIMSLMNDFAAKRAGAGIQSFAVNGDDLVGLWTPEVCDAYEQWCERIGIVVNRKKSFRGSAGVFCEQFGVRTGYTLSLRSFYRLGECSGCKSIDGVRGHMVVDTLRQIADGKVRENFHPTLAPIRRLARHTQLSQTLLHSLPGRLSDGGGGAGQANSLTLRVFLAGGRTSLRMKRKTHAAQELSRRKQVELLALPVVKGGEPACSVADALVQRAMSDELLLRSQCDFLISARVPNARAQEHKQRLICRANGASKVGIFELLHSDDVRARYSAMGRHLAGEHAKHGRFELAIHTLQKHPRKIPLESATAFMAVVPLPTTLRKARVARPSSVGVMSAT